MKQLKNKWLLLDTNAVIEQFLHPGDPFWINFAEEIKSLDCTTFITPEIKFELFRRVRSEADEKQLLSFLEDAEIQTVALSNTDCWMMATKIGQIYAINKLDGKETIDCLIATYLQRYNKSLYLATFNNKDFPIKLFDREVMLNFETDDNIKVLGIYHFSETKFSQLKINFKKSKARNLKRT